MNYTSRSGYTLIELLVILAIMSLIIASLPVLTKKVIDASKRDNAIEQLNEVIMDYRDRSIEAGHPIRISESIIEGKLNFKVHFTGNKNLIFFPDGSASMTIISYHFNNQDGQYRINLLNGDSRD